MAIPPDPDGFKDLRRHSADCSGGERTALGHLRARPLHLSFRTLRTPLNSSPSRHVAQERPAGQGSLADREEAPATPVRDDRYRAPREWGPCPHTGAHCHRCLYSYLYTCVVQQLTQIARCLHRQPGHPHPTSSLARTTHRNPTWHSSRTISSTKADLQKNRHSGSFTKALRSCARSPICSMSRHRLQVRALPNSPAPCFGHAHSRLALWSCSVWRYTRPIRAFNPVTCLAGVLIIRFAVRPAQALRDRRESCRYPVSLPRRLCRPRLL